MPSVKLAELTTTELIALVLNFGIKDERSEVALLMLEEMITRNQAGDPQEYLSELTTRSLGQIYTILPHASALSVVVALEMNRRHNEDFAHIRQEIGMSDPRQYLNQMIENMKIAMQSSVDQIVLSETASLTARNKAQAANLLTVSAALKESIESMNLALRTLEGAGEHPNILTAKSLIYDAKQKLGQLNTLIKSQE